MAPVQGWLSLDLAELEIFAGKRPKIRSVLSLHFAVGPIQRHAARRLNWPLVGRISSASPHLGAAKRGQARGALKKNPKKRRK
jgi:hypothetical protein